MKTRFTILVFIFLYKLSFAQVDSKIFDILSQNYWVPESIQWDSGGFGYGNVIKFSKNSIVRIVSQPFSKQNDSIVAWSTDMNYKKGKWFNKQDSIFIDCKVIYNFYPVERYIIDEETNETIKIEVPQEFVFIGKLENAELMSLDSVKYIKSNCLTENLRGIFEHTIDKIELQ